MACVSSNVLSTCWNISHITPNHHLNRLLPFWDKIVLHDYRWRPSWKLAAILKWSKHSNGMCIIKRSFYLLKHITPNHHLNRLLPFWDKIVLHDYRWRPSRKLAAILKWSKLSNSSYSINCTFYMPKTHNLSSKWSFSTICCHLLAKKRISG